MKAIIDIQPIGGVLTTDSDGYLVKTASADKFPVHWRPAIEDTIAAYKAHFGEKLQSVYVRGSVASGKAIDGISDLDTIALVDIPDEDIKLDWVGLFNKKMTDKYPFIEKIEITADPTEAIETNQPLRILIGTQAVCVYGEDVSSRVPKFKPGKDTVQHVGHIGREIDRVRKQLQEPQSEQFIRTRCVWVTKRILRAGFELVMERSGQYTRDLYPCYEGFSKYYPEKETEMRHVLELALNPTIDPGEVIAALDGIGEWMKEEIQKQGY